MNQLMDAARRELQEETGLVTNTYLETVDTTE